MNHADRERLSELLEDIYMTCGTAYDEKSTFREALDEARAIVDQPAGIITIDGTVNNAPEIRAAMERAFAETGATGKYTILNEPLHEYRDHIPTRRRHRALHPLKLAVALTLAAIGLIATTALTAPQVSTDRPNPQTRPAKPAPEAAQTMFRPGDAPWNTTRRPGTPGNGLGVVTP
jgi:hypothetical protein